MKRRDLVRLAAEDCIRDAAAFGLMIGFAIGVALMGFIWHWWR